MKNCFVLLLSLFLCLFLLSPAQALYYDGYGNYLAMGRNDDGSSSTIPLGFDLNYYGNNFSELVINNNGNVTFDGAMWTYTPFAFPSSRKIIAPFFADVDTRPANGGSVYYDHRIFEGEKEFIATWEAVGYYSNHTSPTNTFQLIIQEDGDIGFSYGEMGWSIGDVSNVHAVAGFDAGDNQNYVMLPNSRTSQIDEYLKNKEFWFYTDTDGDGDPTRNELFITFNTAQYADLADRAQNAHWGGLEIHDSTTNNFKPLVDYDSASQVPFDPTKDTVVMVHGWNSDLDSWIEDMGDAFDGRTDVNIISWNWDDASEHLYVPNQYVPGEAINLSRELSELLGDNYTGDIQLIGHSLGSGIMTRVTQYLQNDYNIERLTLFDGPTQTTADVNLERLLGAINDTVYIENYVTSVGAGYYGGNVNNFALYYDILNSGTIPDYVGAHVGCPKI